jgi:hypothetical protein
MSLGLLPQPGGFEGIVEGWEVTDLGGLPSAKGDDQPELAYLAAKRAAREA